MQTFHLIFCFTFCLLIAVSRPFPVGRIESRNQPSNQVGQDIPDQGYLQTTSLDDLPTLAVEKQQTTENAPSFELNKQPSNNDEEPPFFEPAALNDYYQTEQFNPTPPPQDRSNDVSATSDVIVTSPSNQAPVAVNESALEKFTNDVMTALTDSEGEDSGASTRSPTVGHHPQQNSHRQVDSGENARTEFDQGKFRSDKGTTDGSVSGDYELEKQFKRKGEPGVYREENTQGTMGPKSLVDEGNLGPSQVKDVEFQHFLTTDHRSVQDSLPAESSFLTDQTLKSPSNKESMSPEVVMNTEAPPIKENVSPEVVLNTEAPLKEDPTRQPAIEEFPVTEKRSLKSPSANMDETTKGQISIPHMDTKPRIELQKNLGDDSTLAFHENSGLETQIPPFQSTAQLDAELPSETQELHATAAYFDETLTPQPDDSSYNGATFPDFVSKETPSNYPSLLPQEHVITRIEEIALMYTFPPPITAPDPQPFQPQQHEEVNPETADTSYDQTSAPFGSSDAVVPTETK